MTPELWYALASVLILAGLVGTVLPALPGAPLMWIGMLIVAWVGHFERVGWITLSVLAGMAALTVVTDIVAAALGAKGVGASRLAFLGAALGALIGIFFGFVGLLLGPLVGALIGELIASQSVERATRAGLGAAVGFILGAVAKLVLAFAMLGVFLLQLWRN
jgi:uncharacterized protein YqgC (DUF456 family)